MIFFDYSGIRPRGQTLQELFTKIFEKKIKKPV